MATDLDEQKKLILPFMQRAQEIQQADPKMAYYCRLYAVEQALRIPQRAKEINSLLGATLSSLEKEKVKLDLDPAADRIHCLGFALRIFDNADRIDRAGKATERTSKAYYAASVFMEILHHWEGGVDNEILEKQRYCAWRAAEIRKALREGRQPAPPPAAEPPPLPTGASDGGVGRLDDLPPASGSSDWAYGGSNQIPPQLPPAASGSAIFSGAGSHSGTFIAGGDLPTAPPPPPAGPYPDVPPPPPPALAGSAAGGGARFWPGAKVLVRADEGLDDGFGAGDGEPVVGTVGQVIRRPDGGVSYKVALADRLVELPDEAAVPALEEGDLASLPSHHLPPGTSSALTALPSVPVRVLLINSASWPPSFLIQTPDGKELALAANQLAPPQRRDGPTPAAPPPLPPQPSLPPPLNAQPPQPPAVDCARGPDYGAPAYPHLSLAPSAPPAAPAYPPAYPISHGPGHAGAPPPMPPPAANPYGAPPPPTSVPYNKSYSSPAAPPSAPAAAPVSVPTLPPGFKPSLQAIMEAQKQAKYAISSLSFEDVTTAVKNLSEALRLLTTPGAELPRR